MFYIVLKFFFFRKLHDATLNEIGCLYLNIYISIKHSSDLASSFHRIFRIKFRYSLYYVQSQAMWIRCIIKSSIQNSAEINVFDS